MGISVALGILLTPVSAGSSLAMVSVVTALVSTGLAVAQQFVAESAPKTAAILGWAALGMGIVSGVSSAVLSRMLPEEKSLLSLLKGLINRPCGGLMIEETGVTGRTTETCGAFAPPQRIYPLGVVPDGEGGHSLSFAKGRRVNGIPHLDVYGHGGYGPDGVGYCHVDERSLNATELNEHLLQHVENYSEYDSVRLITCFSADEGYQGESSLASQFAQLSQKNIIAFNGIVNKRFLSGLTGVIMDGAAVNRFKEFNDDLLEVRRFLNERYPPLNTKMEVAGTARLFKPF
ncbi:hypothetical protein NG42_07155 [Winslowiella iniecta]|uniref:Uncharacterized protein n=2 Tax=Winslowiella iniecta TaxID=1560201 RepID=A0A0L7T634_9GAMM|nr:hypothetical protein NG42_07155 [Winslowiella iniecta]KOC94263.1 hypothetical protein NG43_06230 [Winslowiella iniecta]